MITSPPKAAKATLSALRTKVRFVGGMVKNSMAAIVKAVPTGLHAYGAALLARQEKKLLRSARAAKLRSVALLVFIVT
jgi:hypothetical protein